MMCVLSSQAQSGRALRLVRAVVRKLGLLAHLVGSLRSLDRTGREGGVAGVFFVDILHEHVVVIHFVDMLLEFSVSDAVPYRKSLVICHVLILILSGIGIEL